MTAHGDRLRLERPVRASSGRERLYSAPPSPHCQNTGPRPGWLLDSWHCAQDHRLDQRYAMRCEDYWRLYELQEGRCALCGFKPRRYRMAVHHNHATGTIDALLHGPCNRVLDPLLWLLPRLVRLLLDPPGRQLGLVVPAAKLRRLEAAAKAKAERTQTRAKDKQRTNGKAPSRIDQLRAMTKQGGT